MENKRGKNRVGSYRIVVRYPPAQHGSRKKVKLRVKKLNGSSEWECGGNVSARVVQLTLNLATQMNASIFQVCSVLWFW